MTLRSLIKFIGRCVPKGLVIDSHLALMSVAQSLLELRNVLVGDIRRYKDAKLRSVEAKSVSDEADAYKKLAEAAAAANKLTDKESEKARIAVQMEREHIFNRKLAAEAALAEATASEVTCGKPPFAGDPVKMTSVKLSQQVNPDGIRSAKEREIQGSLGSLIEVYAQARKEKIAKANDELIEALKQYCSEGGRASVDEHNLQKILQSLDGNADSTDVESAIVQQSDKGNITKESSDKG